jgi:hypothetical protein
MPVGFGIGDHRMMVVDFTTESMVGINPQAVVRPGARRLNSKIPRCLARYNAKLEELLERHRITEKVVKAHLAANTPDELQVGAAMPNLY